MTNSPPARLDRRASRPAHRAALLAHRAALMLTALGATACGSSVIDTGGFMVRRGGDLVASGADVSVVDSVPGDVMAAGGDIRFTGFAGGDLLSAGGNHVLRGVVLGSLRAAGGNVEVHGDVGRNITLAGGNLVLRPSGRVRGNAYLAGGAIRVDGAVDHLVRATGRDVVLDGVIGGDVNVEAGRLRVGPQAVIRGDLRYRLGTGADAEIEPGARIEGEIIELESRRTQWLFVALRGLWIAAFLFTGVLLVALMPRASRAATATLRRRPFGSLGMGLLWFIVLPLILLLLAATVLGIPLALLGLAVYLGLLYLAPVVVALWIGRLLHRDPRPGRFGLVFAFLMGGVIFALLTLAPYYVGLGVRLLATIFGLGAIAIMAWEGPVRETV